MGDTWIDATQSYENETNTASTEITIVDNVDLLNPPPSSDANYLIKLVNNASTNTNNLYILQANTNGEIRFLTKEAYLNNDVSANDGNQYYNVKIGADGKLYCYYTYNFINNPIKISGWYDIMNDLAGQGFQLTLCCHVVMIMLVVAILLRLIGVFIISSFLILLSSFFVRILIGFTPSSSSED